MTPNFSFPHRSLILLPSFSIPKLGIWFERTNRGGLRVGKMAVPAREWWFATSMEEAERMMTSWWRLCGLCVALAWRQCGNVATSTATYGGHGQSRMDCRRRCNVLHPFLYVTSLRSPFPFSPLTSLFRSFFVFSFSLILSDNSLNFPVYLKECRCSTIFFLSKLNCFFFSFLFFFFK